MLHVGDMSWNELRSCGPGIDKKSRVGLGLGQTRLKGSEITCPLHKKSVNGDLHVSGLVENWARAFGLCTTGPALSPGLRAWA